MRSLTFPLQPPLHLSKPHPWKTTQISTFNPKSNLQCINSKRPQSRAKAKGFSGTPASIKEPGRRDNNRNSIQNNNNNNGEEDDDEITEAVFNRILARILGFVGVPLGTGIAILATFDAIKERNLWDVPVWLPFLTTFLTFGASALGIAYGTLSTSLDPEKSGSFLGFEEAQKNWVEMWKDEDQTQ